MGVGWDDVVQLVVVEVPLIESDASPNINTGIQSFQQEQYYDLSSDSNPCSIS